MPPAAAKTAVNALSALAASASPWTRIGSKDLETIAALLDGRRVVVFIDDLDRADPRLVPKTLLAMRELLDWPGFSFVLAFDKRAISSALYEYSKAFGEDAQGFLEKVIDVPFDVPDPSALQRRRLAERAFAACCDLMPVEVVEALQALLPSQPRRIKMIARTMGSLRPALMRHVIEEIDWLGLCLYLVIKEANTAVANWVVASSTLSEVNWLRWSGDETERKKNEADTRAAIQDLLKKAPLPSDAERIVDAAFRLLGHWAHSSPETVSYWVALVYREPGITNAEFIALQKKFIRSGDTEELSGALKIGASRGRLSETEVASECVTYALGDYQQRLTRMAESTDAVKWKTEFEGADEALRFIEFVWSSGAPSALGWAANQGAAVAALIGTFGQWVTWTRNPGEGDLRTRELDVVRAAVEQCKEPEAVFDSMDPYFNRYHGSDSARIREWRAAIRARLAPIVGTRLIQKVLQNDGLEAVASGDDNLGAWLVESQKSPIYVDASLASELTRTFQSVDSADVGARVAISRNAHLYLRQIMFQTRSASWGGVSDATAIHAAHPALIPAAWLAVVSVSVPFRMMSALRQLRSDLIGIGVLANDLVEPDWLAERTA